MLLDLGRSISRSLLDIYISFLVWVILLGCEDFGCYKGSVIDGYGQGFMTFYGFTVAFTMLFKLHEQQSFLAKLKSFNAVIDVTIAVSHS